MLLLIIAIFLAFSITYFCIPAIITLAKAKKLYDVPDNVRKLHIRPIPSLGGLGIFIGFILSSLLTVNITSAPEFQCYIACSLVLFFVGIKDDILVLSATKKLIAQVVVAVILIFKGHLLITNMYGFLGLYQIDNTLSFLLTLFTIVVVVNSFNLIDGVDGLAGSVGIITSSVFGIFFLINENYSYAILGFGISASVLAFLFYNFQPARIFMGDTGSLLLGLVNSILVIKFIQTAPYYKLNPVSSAPAIGFCILFLPLMDTLRVFGLRIIQGRSPFSPDRNHLHHLLLDRGMNHRSVTLTCSALAIFSAVAGFLLQNIGSTWLIFGAAAFFFVAIYVFNLTKSRMKIGVTRKRLNLFKEEKKVVVGSFSNHTSAKVMEEI